MATQTSLQYGRKYADAEIELLVPSRRPTPLRPYDYSHPAPGQGARLSRRSEDGDRWCPFCQTPLHQSSRAGSCDPCRARRGEVLERTRGGPRTLVPSTPEARQQNQYDVHNILDAIETLSRVIGMASAQRYRNGGMKAEDVNDMLHACKDVLVAADPLRRRLRPGGN